MRRILPPTLLTISIGLMLVLHLIFPVLRILHFPFNLAGIILICLGIWISILGSNHFERKKTTVMTFDTPQVLVTDGLYRYSRNPMYIGFAMSVIGIWLLLGSLSPIIAVVIFLAILDRYYIRFEEAVLQKAFGTEYLEYKRQVRRWI